MLRNVDDLNGFAITATDGAIGEVEDFYFDDQLWVIRYLVVNTGTWLSSRQVLISPISIKQVDRATNQVYVNLTMEQVKRSPDVDTQKPVSRQHETAYFDYYGYPYYWGGPYLWGAAAYPAALTPPPMTAAQTESGVAARQSKQEEHNVHLRSTREVTGYHIEAVDGEIGHVKDFIVDDDSWAVRYLVVDTSNWWFGKKVLLAPQWIERVSWTESKVFVGVSREAVKNSPEYDEGALISREYEAKLYNSHGRRGYWDDEQISRR